MPPKVSVCITNYNYGKYLGQCLTYLLAQDFKDFEAIVIDNCSTDDSEEIARRFEKADKRVRFVKNERNLGMNGNRNRAFELAEGNIIYMLSPDDFVINGILEEISGAFDKNPDVNMVFLNLVTFFDDSKTIKKNIYGKRLSFPMERKLAYFEIAGDILAGRLDKTIMVGSFAIRNVRGLKSRFGVDDPGGEALFLLRYLIETRGLSLYLDRDLFFFRAHGANMGYRVNMEKNFRYYSEELRKLLTENARDKRLMDSLLGSRYYSLGSFVIYLIYSPDMSLRARGLSMMIETAKFHFRLRDLFFYPYDFLKRVVASKVRSLLLKTYGIV